MYHQIARNKRKSVLVVVLFLLFWVLAGAAIGLLVGQSGGTALTGTVVLGVLALLAMLYSYYLGDRTVLAVSGARAADPAQYPELHNIVEALSIGAGLPKPAVYVIDDPSPNAFATGRDPRHAAITATTGLLQLMNREELEGVIAHEMSHVRNYDVRLLLIVSTMVALAGLIASFAWRAAWFSGGRRSRDSGQIGLLIIAVAAVFSLISLLLGPLMELALSRSRESLADASGVELTRNPAGLLGALRKLAANEHPLQNYNHATAAMYIDDPLEHHHHFAHLWDTHPPIEERIAALERIAQVTET
jgi:heat shock protein HtpX